MMRLWRAFLYSLAGLRAAYRDEMAFKQEVWLAVIAVPVACYAAPDGVSLAVLLLSLCMVLVAELLNTAIEAAIDRMGKDIHPLAKKAKDTASAAVFVALVVMVVVWGVVLV